MHHIIRMFCQFQLDQSKHRMYRVITNLYREVQAVK